MNDTQRSNAPSSASPTADSVSSKSPTSADSEIVSAQSSQPEASNGESGVAQDKQLVVVEPQPATSESWFTRVLIQLGLRSKGSLRDDLHEALSGEGDAGGVFSPDERAMLQNILRLRELRVDDVMVPRADIEAVDETIPLGELLQRFEANGHSRMPVFSDNLDDPRGMVLVKDLLLHIVAQSKTRKRKSRAVKQEEAEPVQLGFERVKLDVPLSKVGAIRKVIFVPPSMLAADLMARMQTTRTQMALVIDEYGGTDGLVTLEDIVEEVVGEIEDEHDDEDDLQVVAIGEGVWSVDASADLDAVVALLGPDFEAGDHGEDVDTIGGLVFSLAGHIPVRGEVVRGITGYEFRILDADPRRIKRMNIVHTHPRPQRRKPAGKTDAQD